MFDPDPAELPTIELALLASRAAGGPRAAAKLLLAGGRGALTGRIESLDRAVVKEARGQASALAAGGVHATLCDEPCYPEQLRHAPGAPAALFHQGDVRLLQRPAISICGSRRASAAGLRAAEACGLAATEHGLLLVSGYARGVDSSAHLGALRSGATAMVLAEGIGGFRLRPEFRDAPPERILALSQFPPHQRWTVGGAMARNSVIVGLGRALVVIEAGHTGGTLAAGRAALGARRPVLVLTTGAEATAGSQLLIDGGAIPIGSRRELAAVLGAVAAGPGSRQGELAFG